MTTISLEELLDAVTIRRVRPGTAPITTPSISRAHVGDNPEITSISQDSRTIGPGGIFCAIRGATDGHDFVDSAIERGAAAVVVDHALGSPVPELLVDDTRVAAGHIASAFHGHPSDHLDLVGVTGTNGKTSIVSMVEHLVNSCGGRASSMGTLTGSLTTLPGPGFQAALGEHRTAGVGVVAAEVSSHALDQERIAGSRVRVAVFSNLSQDHLDYHRDMDDYFEAKARLFEPGLSERAVIDVSDAWGAKLAELASIDVVAVDGEAIASSAKLGQRSSTFAWRGRSVRLPLGGRFSVTNAVLAAETCVLLGYDEAELAAGLETTPPIPGRFESVDAGQPFAVLVDYSHTPASVEAAVASARSLTTARVLIVFGAAGDRDPGKRPLMGAAARDADILYVTSDNPRTEDPEMIIDHVVSGAVADGISASAVRRIPDRREAIRSAIADAEEGDVVLIAGKGHEDYQIIGTTRRDFDDRVEARAALADSGWEVSS